MTLHEGDVLEIHSRWADGIVDKSEVGAAWCAPWVVTRVFVDSFMAKQPFETKESRFIFGHINFKVLSRSSEGEVDGAI